MRVPQSTHAEKEAFSSAPGKLILFGEHSVVYGYPAVAVALSDMRISVHARATHSGCLEAILRDLPSTRGDSVSLCANLAALRASLTGVAPLHWRAPAPPSGEAIAAFTAALSGEEGLASTDAAALVPLLFLCYALLPELFEANQTQQEGDVLPRLSGLWLEVRSADLPVGAGLGSSAAFSVSVSAALLQLRFKLRADGGEADELAISTPVEAGSRLGPSVCPCDAAKELIDRWAYAAESILHGTPSGLDNAVSCAGGCHSMSASQ